jgi:dephospho-CoA kinase
MKKYIIGLTGGIGSGKTTVTNLFAELGIEIIDADIVARQVVEPGSEALLAIKAHFGDDIIDIHQQLNRTLLRTRIFSNNDEKLWLNNLLHPLIRNEILRQLANARSCYCILVAPLLIENSLHSIVDQVLVVDIDEATQIARTTQRDPSNAEEVKRIIASQIPRIERLKYANDIIDNSQIDLSQVKLNVTRLDQKYRQLAKRSQLLS